LCDVLAMKEEEAVREKQVMSEVYKKCGLTVQPCAMPSLASLVGRKIQLMHHYCDEDDDGDKGYNVWYTGEVISSCDGEVTVEWEGEWENDEDRKTREEINFVQLFQGIFLGMAYAVPRMMHSIFWLLGNGLLMLCSWQAQHKNGIVPRTAQSPVVEVEGWSMACVDVVP